MTKRTFALATLLALSGCAVGAGSPSPSSDPVSAVSSAPGGRTTVNIKKLRGTTYLTVDRATLEELFYAQGNGNFRDVAVGLITRGSAFTVPDGTTAEVVAEESFAGLARAFTHLRIKGGPADGRDGWAITGSL
ncbi:MAG: hypothetical protein ABIT01_06710 [Thermoanaerobaculia bacterium]